MKREIADRRTMDRRGGVAAMLIVMMVAAGGLPVRAAEMPNGPDVPVSRTFEDRVYTHEVEITIEAYKSIGKRDRSWDAAAIGFLSEIRKRWSGRADARPYEDLERMGVHVVNRLRCDDPLVVYAFANALDNQGKSAGAMPLLRRAQRSLEESGYSRRFSAMAWRRIGVNLRREGKEREAEEALAEARKAMLAVGREPAVRDDPRMYLTMLRNNFLAGLDAGQYERTYREAREDGSVNEWVVKMLGAYAHDRRAWQERGDGFAGTVTERGWVQFREHQERAAALAVEAHGLHPDYPEAASLLVHVSMSGHAPAGTDERYWFDRAVAAEFDHIEAYEHMLWSLMPRWGGSHGAILRFGHECLATGRYDTQVPWQLFRAIENVVMDAGSFPAVLQVPGVSEDVIRMLNAYSRAGKVGNPKWYDCLQAAVFYHTGQYGEALGILNTIQYPELQPGAFARAGLEMHTTLMLIAGLAERDFENGRLLEEFIADGLYDKATELAGELAQPHAHNPGLPIYKYYMHRAWAAERMLDLGLGNEADITPGPLLRGWLIRGGAWWIDEQKRETGGVSEDGANNPRGMAFALDLPVADDFEISGRCRVTQSWYRGMANAGVLFQIGPGESRHALVIDASQSHVRLYYNDHETVVEEVPYTPRPDGDEFRVRFAKGRVSAWVNGQRVIEEVAPPRLWGEEAMVGLGSAAWAGGRWRGSMTCG